MFFFDVVQPLLSLKKRIVCDQNYGIFSVSFYSTNLKSVSLINCAGVDAGLYMYNRKLSMERAVVRNIMQAFSKSVVFDSGNHHR
jgi:hypothetical protein